MAVDEDRSANLVPDSDLTAKALMIARGIDHFAGSHRQHLEQKFGL